VDNVDFAVFLCFFRRFCRPRAGHQVIGTPVLFQANQVERNATELSRPTTLQKQYLVVVRDISVETDVAVLNTLQTQVAKQKGHLSALVTHDANKMSSSETISSIKRVGS